MQAGDMERPPGSPLHERLLLAVERAVQAQATSRALIEQQRVVANSLRETVEGRRASDRDVRKRTP
jgi:hypothetical protein